MDEWISEMWHIVAAEYYLAIKRNEVPIQVATWINFENMSGEEVSLKELHMV